MTTPTPGPAGPGTTPNDAPGTPEPGASQPDPDDKAGQATDRDAQVTALNAEAAKYRRQAREAQSEIEKLKLANATETERAIAAAKAEGANEYASKWRKALVSNAALAALAEKGVTATEPALRSLDLDGVDVDDDGTFDVKAVKARVDDLLERYPIFAPTGGAPALPTLTGDTQRRITSDARVKPGGRDQSEELLRYALGGR